MFSRITVWQEVIVWQEVNYSMEQGYYPLEEPIMSMINMGSSGKKNHRTYFPFLFSVFSKSFWEIVV
jgi:hypothetical protein